MLTFKNYTKQGNVGLGFAIAYYTSKGYAVSIPLNDSQKYDLIFDDGVLNKVQVKTTRSKSKANNFMVYLRTISGRKVLGFFPNTFDFLFVLTENKEIYQIPSKILLNYKNAITLNEKFEEFKIYL